MNAAAPAQLRRLYFTRAGFAVIWAALLGANASDLNPGSALLLILYPGVDVFALLLDAHNVRDSRSRTSLFISIVISALAGIGIIVAVASGIPAVLRGWGAWAIAAGLLQVAVGIGRRGLGGQWAMIISGAGSALAGISFIVRAGQDDPGLDPLAGYALLGGIFFLVSAIRLGCGRDRSGAPEPDTGAAASSWEQTR